MYHDKAMELVAALRSGKYKQCKSALHTTTGFCCLGVACDISGVTWRVDPELSYRYCAYETNETNESFEVAVLPDKIQELFGFKDNVGYIDDETLYIDEDGRNYDCLAEMNDAGIPFSVIADVIEKHWERL
jgi:hypothetical protein